MAATSIHALVESLKNAGEDHEFYPTTERMISLVTEDMKGWFDEHHRYGYNRPAPTVLDVGAGNGAFLQAVLKIKPSAELLAIEKSDILIAELVRFAKVIGTDFHQQSFLPKQVSSLFCNPPYSEYSSWTSRLIKECPADVMYFVVPARWKDDKDIAAALEFRKSQVTKLGEDTFLDGPRAARAKVDILRIEPQDNKDDLFDRFFLERFGHLKDRMNQSLEKKTQEKTQRKNSLVERSGLIGALVELYTIEMDRLVANYEKAVSLDAELLMELGLSIQTIIETLKNKIDTLKGGYWSELFSHLDTVTSRLTVKNRQQIMDRIGGFKAVDFTHSNIYAVVLWVMENSGQYIEKQILEVFDTMLSKANVHNYKSNQKVYGEGNYRYMDVKPTHVALDFRIVLETGFYGFRNRYSWEPERLSESGSTFVDDLLCVANLLGYAYIRDPKEWRPGKPVTFVDSEGNAIAEFKAHRNGNMHVRMSQKLALSLNVAVGKLRGWIRDSHEAKEEFSEAAQGAGVDIETVFNKEFRLKPNSILIEMNAPHKKSA